MKHDPFDDGGRMSMPSPMDPNSGWTTRPNTAPDQPGFARGEAPDMAPPGMVFVAGLNTYVEPDIASSLGLLSAGPQGPSGSPEAHPFPDGLPQALDPRAIPAGHDPHEIVDEADYEMADEELEALQEQLEVQPEPSLSETMDELSGYFTAKDFDDGLSALVATGDMADAVSRIAQATGLDDASAVSVVSTAIDEASAYGVEAIGDECWSALVYAATSTPDPFARRVVADFVQGSLHPSKLERAYAMWYQSLPDYDDPEG